MELDISGKVEMVEERIEAACRRSGRKRQEIKLMAVTKFKPLEAVEAAFKAGIKLFGESRVQEATGKFSRFWETYQRDGSVELHLIGSLQRNKAKTAETFFDCIQSVDRDSLLDELGALTQGRKSPLMIMLEYHTGEETKSGFPDQESLLKAAEKALSFSGLRPVGLMTMAPFTTDEAAIRLSFRKLISARDELVKRFGAEEENWSCLSMGMTNDFEIAVEEGSTLLRVGTAIFGESGA
jgi:pyridoxal phosphate enzyme (YggS family)